MKTRESIAHNTQKALNGGSHDHRQEFLHIKQGDKFFSRLLSKEKSSSSSSIKGESSFRFFYYGDSGKGSIPFRWESQPGTPKHPLSAASLPPLTPPPSYQSSGELNSGRRRGSSSRLPSFLFSKLSSKKTSFRNSSSNVSSSISSSSCSSSFSLPSSAATAALGVRRHRSQSDFQLRLEDLFRDDDDASPASTLCFGGGRGNGGAAAAASGSGCGSKSFHARRSSWLCLNNISVF